MNFKFRTKSCLLLSKEENVFQTLWRGEGLKKKVVAQFHNKRVIVIL